MNILWSPDAHLTGGKCFFRKAFFEELVGEVWRREYGMGQMPRHLFDEFSYQPPPPPPPPPPPEEPPPLLPLDEDGLVAAAATAAVIAVPRPAVVAAMVDEPHPAP